MISRDTAEKALKQMEYERFSIAPSISGYSRGISINIYFAGGISKTYSYGNADKVDGYIAPIRMLHNHKAIQKMIGWNGPIIIIDSKGKEYVGN